MGSGNRIDEFVYSKGITFRALAKEVGISARHLRYIRRGSNPRLDLAQAIADALGQPVIEVFPK